MGAAEKHGPAAHPGIDVGKGGHGARALDAAGGVVFRADLDNEPDAIDRLPERAGDAAPVVDQKRNIGALVPAGAHAPGRRCAHPPGYAEKRARDMMPGIAKTDAIDAEVIARTAMGMPRALGPIAAEDAAARSLRAPSSQREHAVASGTRAKNRLRAVPLEADPEPERAADPSSPRQMAALSELGGAPGRSAAGRGAFADAARRGRAGREGQGAPGGARRVGGVREGRWPATRSARARSRYPA